MKTPNKRELQKIGLDFKYFMKIYKKCTVEPYFLVNDTTFTSNNPLRFRKILLK